jgi:hypothetical protein
VWRRLLAALLDGVPDVASAAVDADGATALCSALERGGHGTRLAAAAAASQLLRRSEKARWVLAMVCHGQGVSLGRWGAGLPMRLHPELAKSRQSDSSISHKLHADNANGQNRGCCSVIVM